MKALQIKTNHLFYLQVNSLDNILQVILKLVVIPTVNGELANVSLFDI